MKSMYNPASDICRRVSDPEARKLAGYGWRYVTKAKYKLWITQQAFLNAKLLRANHQNYPWDQRYV